MIHRERYGDWALPKGTLHAGEHPLAAAVREVAEETGVRGRPQLRLPAARYRAGGDQKQVDYWLMRALAVPEFRPNAEVDAVAWLPTRVAMGRLSYPHDALLVRRWELLPQITSVVLLVRHAFAGLRHEWPGADRDRPLTPDGVVDAERLCRLVALFSPQRLVSATPLRCRQTLAPLAKWSGLPVAVDDAFDESHSGDGGDDAAATAAGHLRAVATTAAATVVCTQGRLIGPTLHHLTGDRRYARSTTRKGDGWLVPFSGPLPLAPTGLAVGPPLR